MPRFEERQQKRFSHRLDSALIAAICHEHGSDDEQGATATLVLLASEHPTRPPETHAESFMIDDVEVWSDIVAATPTPAPRGSYADALRNASPPRSTPLSTALGQFYGACFPDAPPGVIGEIVGMYGDDIDAGMNALLTRLALDDDDVRDQRAYEHDGELATLISMFPNLDSERLKDLMASCGDLDSAINAALLLDPPKPINELNNEAPEADFVPVRGRRRNGVEPNASRAASLSQLIAAPSTPPRPERRHVESVQRLSDLMQMRNDAFTRASAAFKSGNHIQGGIAFYYAEEGRKFHSELQKYKLDAARATLADNQQRHRKENTIDLHYLTVNEALILLGEELFSWYRRETQHDPRPKRGLTVVTGQGRGRPGGSRLFTSVMKYLTDNRWNFTEHPGHFIVTDKRR